MGVGDGYGCDGGRGKRKEEEEEEEEGQLLIDQRTTLMQASEARERAFLSHAMGTLA